MRFYFDIDEAEFYDECGMDFKETVKDRVIESIADTIFSNVSNILTVGILMPISTSMNCYSPSRMKSSKLSLSV